MKTLAAISTLFLTLSFAPMTAHAEGDTDILCSAYGKIGGYFASAMLPVTVQELVDMMAGKNPELNNKIANGLLSDLSGREVVVISEFKDVELLAMAAGQTAMQLLIGGQTTSKAETIQLMNSHCLSIGVQSIVENQKVARDATNANMQE